MKRDTHRTPRCFTPKIMVVVLPGSCGTIHIEPEVELLRVLDLVGGDHPGAEGDRRSSSPCPCPI
jgi:hypothetical protein